MKNVYIVKVMDTELEVYSTKKKAIAAVHSIAKAQDRTITETCGQYYMFTFWDEHEQIAEILVQPVL